MSCFCRSNLFNLECKGVMWSFMETLIFFSFRTGSPRNFALLTSLLTSFAITCLIPLLVGTRWHILMSTRLRATLASTWMTGSSGLKILILSRCPFWSIAYAINKHASRWSWSDWPGFWSFSSFFIRSSTSGLHSIHIGNASHWTLLEGSWIARQTEAPQLSSRILWTLHSIKCIEPSCH